MKIERIITDIYGYQENCYILENNNDVLIIDPGNDYDKIKKQIENKNLLGVLITHYHPDHIGALNLLLNDYKVDIYDFKLDEKEYNINKFKFNIIKTPGHTDDSITFYFKEDEVMFTGDFIFKETIGRTDLPTGDFNKMNDSIDMIKKYDKNIKLYPGHGDSTTLDYEINNNYYFM